MCVCMYVCTCGARGGSESRQGGRMEPGGPAAGTERGCVCVEPELAHVRVYSNIIENPTILNEF
jgi:hypothetical protein